MLLAAFKPTSLVSSGPYTYGLDDVTTAYLTLKWQPNSLYSGSVKFGDIKLWQGDTDATTPLVLSGEDVDYFVDALSATIERAQHMPASLTRFALTAAGIRS